MGSTASDLAPETEDPQSAVHDFDFYFGTWRIHHKQLVERLAGSTTWREFESTSTAWPIMGGTGNIDDNVLEHPNGTYRAISLRSFDPATGQWAIWWVDSRSPHGALDPPVKGKFVDGVGTFYADDTLRGKPIRVRFTWSKITPTSARWEQAFSPDGGKTWELNWTMQFQRNGS